MNMSAQKGFATLYFVLLSLFLVVSIIGSSFLLVLWQQRIGRNAQNSVQAYWAGEAGLEDALFRIKNSLAWTSPISLIVGEGVVGTTITDEGTTKTVVAEGNDSSRVRKVEAVYRQGIAPQFFYGAHVGEAGLVMDNNSKVIGNVFVNGDIQGDSGAIVTETITVAGSGSELKDITVEGDAYVDACQDAEIQGTLHTNDNDDCDFGALATLGTPPDLIPLPITIDQIQEWKDAAEAGGVIMGNYKLDRSNTAFLGPRKIVGDLMVEDKAVLTLTGTLWVTGKVDVKNEANVRLDASYGAASGVLVADGLITLQNNSVSSGSGTQGSYLMYLSTSMGNPAVNTKNNAIADIIYASAGWIAVENNDELREVTGYGIHLKNNATVTYEAGLLNASFTSGPGIGWELSSWQEVE
jgi:Tfp pilus assembly protein PilX